MSDKCNCDSSVTSVTSVTVSRLAEMCTVIPFTGPDRRRHMAAERAKRDE